MEEMSKKKLIEYKEVKGSNHKLLLSFSKSTIEE